MLLASRTCWVAAPLYLSDGATGSALRAIAACGSPTAGVRASGERRCSREPEPRAPERPPERRRAAGRGQGAIFQSGGPRAANSALTLLVEDYARRNRVPGRCPHLLQCPAIWPGPKIAMPDTRD